MKIEDIKPDDVIVRTKDKILFKVAEVTPEGKIMQSANGKMNEVLCIFQEPKTMSFCSEEDYEPATEEQRRYMDSKLAAFYGTNPEVESKRITALATMMGDLKQENNELVERVKQLMSDYNNVVKQLQATPMLSELTEALDKVKHLERDKDFLRREIEQLQDYNALLRKQLNTANANCKEIEEKLKKQYEDYYALRDCNEVAESRIARFEKSTFERMEHDCPYGVKAIVGTLACFNCEHYIKSDSGCIGIILCAHDYDKEKEKQQEEDKFYRKMNRYFNEK